MLRLGVIASGTGTNLQCIIDAIESGLLKASIEVVISDRQGSGALERAETQGINNALVLKDDYSSRAEFDDELRRILEANNVELVVLAGFMRVLGQSFIDAFPMKIINIHPALLPSFTGLHVHEKAIRHGVKFSGCTVHFVDKGLDTGPIIIQAVVPLLDDDTEQSLSARILREEHRILPEAISLIAAGSVEVVERRVVLRKKAAINSHMALENPAASIFEE